MKIPSWTQKKEVTYAVVILFMVGFGFFSLWQNSTTNLMFDEGGHIFAGYSFLKTGEYAGKGNEVHPPLSKVVSGLPLLFMDLNDEILSTSWQKEHYQHSAIRFMYEDNLERVDAIVFWSRIPLILLGMLLVFVVFVVGRSMFGRSAGLLASFLTGFSPTIIANTPIVYNDLIFSLAVVLFVWRLYAYTQKASNRNVVWLGLSLAFAFLTKFTAILLLGSGFLVLLYVLFFQKAAPGNLKYALEKSRRSRRKSWVLILHGVLVVLLFCFLVNLSYLFQGSFQPLVFSEEEMEIIEGTSLPYKEEMLELAAFPSVFPTSYVKGVSYHMWKNQKSETYLFGEKSTEGYWYYYLVALLVKTPLAFLILFFWALGYVLWRKRLLIEKNLHLLFPVIVILGAFSFLSTKQIGIRYVMAVLPLIYLFIGNLFDGVVLKRVDLKLGLVKVLCLWYLVALILIAPFTMSYFNELVGPSEGYRVLLDNNVDLNQGLKRVSAFVQEEGFVDYRFSYLGENSPKFFDVAVYGIDAEPVPCEPTVGVFVIGAAKMKTDCHRWLLEYVPVQQFEYSFHVYDIKKLKKI